MAQATFHLDLRKFSGGIEEDVDQWIAEVDRTAIALGIEDPDDNDCPWKDYAAAYLTGEAALVWSK